MGSNVVWWILIILILIFIWKFVVPFWKGFVDGYSQARGIPVEKDYRANKLLLKIYYGRGAGSAVADLDEWERTGVIRVVIFSTKTPTNEVERQLEGKWADAGPAIVRIKEGTNEVVAWQYFK